MSAVPLAEESGEQGVAAWLLSPGHACTVAVGKFEVRHLLTNPKTYCLPRAPEYCRRLLWWNDRLVPIFDLAGWMVDADGVTRAVNSEESLSASIYAIVGYNTITSPIEYGAFEILEPPKMVYVKDSDFMTPDNKFAAKKAAIHSCFNDDGRSIPIINVGKIFSGLLTDPG